LPLQFQSERNSADHNDNGFNQVYNTNYGTTQYNVPNQQYPQQQPPMIHTQQHPPVADHSTYIDQHPSGNYQQETQQYKTYNNNNSANNNIAPPTLHTETGPMNLNQNTKVPIFTAASLPPHHSLVNSPQVSSSNQYDTNSSPVGPPPGSSIGPPPQAAYRQATSSSNTRIIMPDGFHTSASDPELQKKYGHVKTVIDIAPPPTFSSMGPSGGIKNKSFKFRVSACHDYALCF
jgi:hypothetical protein